MVRPTILLAALLSLSGPSCVAGQEDAAHFIARIEGPQQPNRQGLDGFTLEQLMARFRVPGASVAVLKGSKVHWAKAYGVADVETGRRVDTETAFQAASISKSLTSMAVLSLVQDGRLSLDQDIASLLKSWSMPRSQWGPVPLRALLSHTSGADDGFGFPGYEPSAVLPTIPQILDGEEPSNVRGFAFVRPPFAAYKYSGGGYALTQLALTDFLGEPFAQFMRDGVLTPLGMRNSSFEQPPGGLIASRAARAHNAQGRPMNVAFHVYPEQAAAGLWTTPSDLALFVTELQTALRGTKGRVLGTGAAREMIAPVSTGPYGLGLTIQELGEGWYFGHTGSNWGFRAEIVGHIAKGYGLVVMTNGDNGVPLIQEIKSRVAAAYSWDTLDKPLVR